MLAYRGEGWPAEVDKAAGVSLPRVREAEKRFLCHQQGDRLAEACGDDSGS